MNKLVEKEVLNTYSFQFSKLRGSAKKINPILKLIRGLNVEQAIRQLKFLEKEAARNIHPMLKSAMTSISDGAATSSNYFESFFIKEATVGKDMHLSRVVPRARRRTDVKKMRFSKVHFILQQLI